MQQRDEGGGPLGVGETERAYVRFLEDGRSRNHQSWSYYVYEVSNTATCCCLSLWRQEMKHCEGIKHIFILFVKVAHKKE